MKHGSGSEQCEGGRQCQGTDLASLVMRASGSVDGHAELKEVGSGQ